MMRRLINHFRGRGLDAVDQAFEDCRRLVQDDSDDIQHTKDVLNGLAECDTSSTDPWEDQ